MADSYTVNYSFVQMEPGTIGWDAKNNANFQLIDTEIFNRAQEIALLDTDLGVVEGIMPATAGVAQSSRAVVLDSNKDISGIRNVTQEGSLKIQNDPTAKTSLAGRVAKTLNSDTTHVGQYTKIASVNISVLAHVINTKLVFQNIANGQLKRSFAEIEFLVQQQAAFGNNPYITLKYINVDGGSANDFGSNPLDGFVAVVIRNTPDTLVELYLKPNSIYTDFYISEIASHKSLSATLTYYSNQPYSASLPAGTAQNIEYADNKAVAGRLLDVQVFTASGTWNKPAGTNAIEVWAIGGGGAGGGTTGLNVSPQALAGGGGSSGQGSYSYLTSGFGTSETVTIGAGGVGSAGATGGVGGDTSFGSLLVAKGGYGGGAAPGGAQKYLNGGINTVSQPGQVGQLLIPSSAGHCGSVSAANWTTSDDWSMAKGGDGANSPWGYGNGGSGPHHEDDIDGGGFVANGYPATGYGAGGGGGETVNANTTQTLGGNGSAGLVIIKSYA